MIGDIDKVRGHFTVRACHRRQTVKSEWAEKNLVIEALQSLQDDAVRLDEFISKADRFNLFEAAGIVDWELSHSQILSFLLDPRGNHGMHDAFLRPLLDRILKSALQTGIIASSIDLRPRTLDNVIVLREHRNIDILVVDEAHGLVVIIENKIRSDEHSDQLARYLKIVKAEYPHCRPIIGVFLTPKGKLPSEPNRTTYVALDYGQIYAVLREVIDDGATIDADVSVMLRHYADLIRRHIVSESDIAEISQQIYARHKRAIDLIIEHLPARQASLRAEIEALVRAESEFQYEVTDSKFVYFTAKPWVDERLIQQSQKWTTDKLLAFAFDYTGIGGYSLTLTVGPGDRVALSQERRAALLRMAEMDKNVYNHSTTDAIGQHRWTNIYYRQFFEPDFLTQATLAQALEQLRASWALFLRDLPNLIAGIKLDALP